jgi:hypothetical protein
LSVLDYGCEVWDVFGETQSKRLQKLQNRAARIILNISNDVDYTIALRTQLGWEPLQTERKKTKARMMYKLLNKMGPKSLTIYFRLRVRKLITTFGMSQVVFIDQNHVQIA